MADFRHQLYPRYVTTLKGGVVPTDDAALHAYYASCAAWYLPFLRDLSSDAPILELGCGPGHLMVFLQRQGYTRVEGIDLSEEQVRIAAERGLDARAADAWEFLPEHPGAYAAIVAVDFLEHFTREELLRLLPAIRDALQPGGRLLLQTPNGRGLFPGDVIYGDLTHLTIFTEDSLAQLLRLFGFQDIRFAETAPVATSFKARFRVLSWKLIRRLANLARRIEAGKHQDVWTENLLCSCRKA